MKRILTGLVVFSAITGIYAQDITCIWKGNRIRGKLVLNEIK